MYLSCPRLSYCWCFRLKRCRNFLPLWPKHRPEPCFEWLFFVWCLFLRLPMVPNDLCLLFYQPLSLSCWNCMEIPDFPIRPGGSYTHNSSFRLFCCLLLPHQYFFVFLKLLVVFGLNLDKPYWRPRCFPYFRLVLLSLLILLNFSLRPLFLLIFLQPYFCIVANHLLLWLFVPEKPVVNILLLL